MISNWKYKAIQGLHFKQWFNANTTITSECEEIIKIFVERYREIRNCISHWWKFRYDCCGLFLPYHTTFVSWDILN